MQSFQTKYKIKACGLNLHKLIAFFEQNNISLESVERPNQKALIFTISKNDYILLKKHGVYKEYKFHKINEKSIKNSIKFICNNLGLLLGVLFCFSTIITTTCRLYEIDFNTENHICSNHENCIFSEQNQSLLTTFLKDIGVSENSKINELPSSKDIESSLVKNFEQISGAKVYLNGVKLHIDIIEAKLNPTNAEANLLAPHNGIIISTKVMNGVLKVKNGDTVLKGQILVEKSGDLPISAEIVIRAFYHESSIFEEQQISYEETGNKFYTNTISCLGLNFANNKSCPFKLYNSFTSKKYSSLNMLLPIEITTTTYVELIKKETFMDYSTQEEIIKKELEQTTSTLIPSNAAQKNITFTTFREGTRVRTDCYIEVLLTVSA